MPLQDRAAYKVNKNKMQILVSGGAGYIGSAVVSALHNNGHTPLILDNLSTGKKEFVDGHIFYQGDIADTQLVNTICQQHAIDAVIHCAALIIVSESVEQPSTYYHENVVKTLSFVRTLQKNNIARVLFSSSASVYDVSDTFEVTETSPCKPQSPYARTKLIVDFMLEDIAYSTALRAISLRYFNPIGAHPQFKSGPNVKRPTHVLGKILDAYFGNIPQFEITGTAYNTRDGSGMRDYIHVWDLALAHVQAVERFDAIVTDPLARHNFCIINVGTGTGSTVRELLAAFHSATNATISVVEAPPRRGDVAGVYANTERAKKLLRWETQYSIPTAIEHHIQWLQIRKKRFGY